MAFLSGWADILENKLSQQESKKKKTREIWE